MVINLYTEQKTYKKKNTIMFCLKLKESCFSQNFSLFYSYRGGWRKKTTKCQLKFLRDYLIFWPNALGYISCTKVFELRFMYKFCYFLLLKFWFIVTFFLFSRFWWYLWTKLPKHNTFEPLKIFLKTGYKRVPIEISAKFAPNSKNFNFL